MLLSEMVLLTDFFIIILTVASFKIPFSSWVANILSLMCLVSIVTEITNSFVIEITVVTILISIIATIFNVYGRLVE